MRRFAPNANNAQDTKHNRQEELVKHLGARTGSMASKCRREARPLRKKRARKEVKVYLTRTTCLDYLVLKRLLCFRCSGTRTFAPKLPRGERLHFKNSAQPGSTTVTKVLNIRRKCTKPAPPVMRTTRSTRRFTSMEVSHCCAVGCFWPRSRLALSGGSSFATSNMVELTVCCKCDRCCMAGRSAGPAMDIPTARAGFSLLKLSNTYYVLRTLHKTKAIPPPD